MGILYYPLPLTKEYKEGLEDFYGISLPVIVEDSRYPTPNEIRSVLGQLEGYRTDYSVGANNWYADISDTAIPKEGHRNSHRLYELSARE